MTNKGAMTEENIVTEHKVSTQPNINLEEATFENVKRVIDYDSMAMEGGVDRKEDSVDTTVMLQQRLGANHDNRRLSSKESLPDEVDAMMINTASLSKGTKDGQVESGQNSSIDNEISSNLQVQSPAQLMRPILGSHEGADTNKSKQLSLRSGLQSMRIDQDTLQNSFEEGAKSSSLWRRQATNANPPESGKMTIEQTLDSREVVKDNEQYKRETEGD